MTWKSANILACEQALIISAAGCVFLHLHLEMSWGESVGSLAPIIICGATPLTKPLTSLLSSKPYTFSQAKKCS